jgi:hypothetical protein
MMKRLLWMSVLPGLLLSATATANPLPLAQIGLYGDPAGTVNVVFDLAPGLIELHVVQIVNVESVGAVRFAAQPPPCFTATYLGENHYHATMGDSQQGAWVLYGPCATGTVHVMTIQFAGYGTSGHCCWFEPQAYPGSSYIESQICNDAYWHWTYGEGIYISTVPGYHCGTPVEQTTWSGIKAMYR